MWKLGLKTDLLPIIYKLNEESEITVKTPLGNTNRFIIPRVCKQGTVLIPPLCSASVAECCDEHKTGGASIGSLVIRSLAFMDDLMDLNTTVRDSHSAHNDVTFFSKKKNMPLNEDKCICMAVNNKHPHPTPVLTLNNKTLKMKKEAKYLGDVFNENGNNSGLIKDRKNTAIRCLISCMAECQSITRGVKVIRSKALLYKSVYLQTVIFNCEAWDNLTKTDIHQLEILQMKYLKRMLQVPKATPNNIVMLELGVIPIEMEIKSRQLNFYHKILQLEESDPVKQAFEQEKRYPFEKNWANEIMETLSRFEIHESEEVIKAMPEQTWKNIYKKRIKEVAFKQLLEERLKKGANLRYEKLSRRGYFDILPFQDAKLIFKLRAEVYDIKAFRKFQYEDDICRLCNAGTENLEHIVNLCPEVPRTDSVTDLLTEDLDDLKAMIRRVKFFDEMVNLV